MFNNAPEPAEDKPTAVTIDRDRCVFHFDVRIDKQLSTQVAVPSQSSKVRNLERPLKLTWRKNHSDKSAAVVALKTLQHHWPVENEAIEVWEQSGRSAVIATQKALPKGIRLPQVFPAIRSWLEVQGAQTRIRY